MSDNRDKLIKLINRITLRLNNFNKLSSKKKYILRKRRHILMHRLINLPNFDKNKNYFILPYTKPKLFVSYNTRLLLVILNHYYITILEMK